MIEDFQEAYTHNQHAIGQNHSRLGNKHLPTVVKPLLLRAQHTLIIHTRHQLMPCTTQTEHEQGRKNHPTTGIVVGEAKCQHDKKHRDARLEHAQLAAKVPYLANLGTDERLQHPGEGKQATE